MRSSPSKLSGLQSRFRQVDGDLDCRHDERYSGYNMLTIGASYEAMMRWLGWGNRVMAMSKIHVPLRRNNSGETDLGNHPRPRGYPLRAGQRSAGPHEGE